MRLAAKLAMRRRNSPLRLYTIHRANPQHQRQKAMPTISTGDDILLEY